MGISKAERYLRRLNYYLVRANKNRRPTDLEKYYVLKFLLDDEPKSVVELIELVSDAIGKPLDPRDKAVYMRFYHFVRRLVKDGLVEVKREGLEYLFTADKRVKAELQKRYGSDKLFIMTVKDKDELKAVIRDELVSEFASKFDELYRSIASLRDLLDKRFGDFERELSSIRSELEDLASNDAQFKSELSSLSSSLEKLSNEVYNMRVLHEGVLRELAQFLSSEIKITNPKLDLSKKPFTRRLLGESSSPSSTKSKRKIVHIQKKGRSDDMANLPENPIDIDL